MPGAAPAAALKTTNAARAARKTRRLPNVSPIRPAVTSVRANARAYPDTTHCTDAAEACRSRCTEGRATATIVTSSRVMKPATSVTHRARHRFGSGWSSGRCTGAPLVRWTRSPASRLRHPVTGVQTP